MSAEFKPDMHLHKIRACVSQDQLNGLTFTLRTKEDKDIVVRDDEAVTDPLPDSDPVTIFEL